jgi:GDP-L-fucose synthase
MSQPLMSPDTRIFVAGHRGLVGSGLCEALSARGYRNLVTRTRQELDLRNTAAVERFYQEARPEVVFLAAAKVGGILANDRYRADFIHENLQIQDNVINGAHLAGVRRLVFLGSSCIYPRLASQPIHETSLLTGPLEYTNRSYALAKIAGLELVHALRVQHGRDYFSVMPTNLYGPRDNFHPENSHVVPALIRRFCAAEAEKAPSVTVWGTGKPLRELMLAGDCAETIVNLAERLTFDDLAKSSIGQANWSHVNVGSGQEASIAELAEMVAKAVGYQGRLVFDSTKPDGTPRKLLDLGFLRERGLMPKMTPLDEGLRLAVAWYRDHCKA